MKECFLINCILVVICSYLWFIYISVAAGFSLRRFDRASPEPVSESRCLQRECICRNCILVVICSYLWLLIGRQFNRRGPPTPWLLRVVVRQSFNVGGGIEGDLITARKCACPSTNQNLFHS